MGGPARPCECLCVYLLYGRALQSEADTRGSSLHKIGALPLELGTLTAKRGLLLGTLVYLELLASRYWLGGSTWTLFHMLPWLLVGGAVALFAGRGALGELRKERLAGSASLAPAQAAVSSS